VARVTIYDVDERSPLTYEATLLDETGAPVALGSIESITLTLYNADGDEPANIVNGRDHQDIKNANDVTIDATSGKLTWAVQPADTAIVDARLGYERHVALFEYVTTGNKRQPAHEVMLRVRNVRKVA